MHRKASRGNAALSRESCGDRFVYRENMHFASTSICRIYFVPYPHSPFATILTGQFLLTRMEAPTIDAPTTDAPAAKELAQRVHDDGFVALEAAAFRPSEDVTRSVREQVLRRFTSFLATAEAEQIDLALPANAERLAGFYVREGGRIDMQLSTTAVQTKAVDFVVEAVDLKPLRTLADKWRPVLDELFSPDEYALEYIGCVLSRPGDDDQNWHLDGVHRNLTKHEPGEVVCQVLN